MIIQYRFEYIHNNGLFIRLLNKIASDSLLDIFLRKEGEHYFLECEADQEPLEQLALKISAIVPSSLFLKEAALKEVTEFSCSDRSLEDDTKFYAIPFCIECQNSILENPNNLQLECKVCGFSDVDTIDVDRIDRGVEEFNATSEVTLVTQNGERVFSKSSKGFSSILCNDYANISEYFLITENELNALICVEKPSIKLKPKLKFRAEYGLDDAFYNVFLPDDKVTLALATKLKDQKLLFCDDTNMPRISAAKSRTLIIHAGRDIIKKDIDSHIDMLRSIVEEHKLGAPSVCVIHLSQTSHSSIFSFNAKVGLTKMVEFENLPLKMADIFTMIEQSDENAQKLIENYRKNFNEHYERVEKYIFDTSTNPFTQLFKIVEILLGIENLAATAIEFSGKSGPRIDYKVKNEEGRYILDLTRVIRSIISFKLAGVDDYLLSFGIFDSLADFLADQAQSADENISIDAVFLSGDLFENRQLFARTLSAIEPNYKIYTEERVTIWN